MRVLQLSDIEPVEADGLRWLPLRRALGATAFGTNAYTADAGELLGHSLGAAATSLASRLAAAPA